MVGLGDVVVWVFVFFSVFWWGVFFFVIESIMVGEWNYFKKVRVVFFYGDIIYICSLLNFL